MTTFTINSENEIIAFTAAEQVPEGQQRFATEKELAKVSAEWTISRFVEVWNGFAGVVPFDTLKPVKKFTDRKSALSRIWKAIQVLTPTPAPKAATVEPKKAKTTKEPKNENGVPAAREGSKKSIVLALIRRPEGASLKEIMEATQWQSHSVRGFLSGSLTKKMALNIESFKRDSGDRAYRISA